MLHANLLGFGPDHCERTWEAASSFLDRLGRDRVVEGEDGYTSTITAAAAAADADGATLAWVDSREKEVRPEYWDVSHTLHVSNADGHGTRWELPTYNPYFGCEVGFLGWYGDAIAIVYREKHHMLLAVFDTSTEKGRLLPLNDDWCEEGDVVYSLSKDRNLIEVCSLPDLCVGVPIPKNLWPGAKRFEARAPSSPDAFAASVATRIFGARVPQPLADLLIGATCRRYWNDWLSPVRSYRSLPCQFMSPFWLPWYWYQAIEEREKAMMLGELETMAKFSIAGDSGATFAVEMATTHVCRSAGVWARACRDGELPDKEQCYFWMDGAQENLRRTIDQYPAGFREVYEQLRRARMPRREAWIRRLFGR